MKHRANVSFRVGGRARVVLLLNLYSTRVKNRELLLVVEESNRTPPDYINKKYWKCLPSMRKDDDRLTKVYPLLISKLDSGHFAALGQ